MIRLLKRLLGLCCHDDEIQDRILWKFPSTQEDELLAKMGSKTITTRDSVPLLDRRSIRVTVVHCKKCGRVKYMRTRNP